MSVSRINILFIQNELTGRHILNIIKDIPIGETRFGDTEISDRINYYKLNIDFSNYRIQDQFEGFQILNNEVKYTITIENNLIRVNIQCNENILEICKCLLTAIFTLNEGGLSLTAIKKKDSHLLTKGV